MKRTSHMCNLESSKKPVWEHVKHRVEGSKDSFSLKENCEVGKYEI